MAASENTIINVRRYFIQFVRRNKNTKNENVGIK